MSILFLLIFVGIILVSLSVHEYAHAKTADMLGDPTPRLAGRLTLNPLVHIDPMGFLALLIFRIGWAKPVPINPYNFRDPQRGELLTGLAGPLSNFVLAWVLASVLRVFPMNNIMLVQVIQSAIFLNLALMVFNLLPVPPLDGSHIYTRHLPVEWQINLERYGFFILIGILFFPATRELLLFMIYFLYNLIV